MTKVRRIKYFRNLFERVNFLENFYDLIIIFVSDVSSEVTTQAAENTKVPATDAPNNDEYDEVDDSEYEEVDNSNGFEVSVSVPVY